jgi:hypothetical protein
MSGDIERANGLKQLHTSHLARPDSKKVLNEMQEMTACELNKLCVLY